MTDGMRQQKNSCEGEAALLHNLANELRDVIENQQAEK